MTIISKNNFDIKMYKDDCQYNFSPKDTIVNKLL